MYFIMLIESLPNFTLTYAAHLFMGVLTLLAYFKLRRSYQDSGAETVGYFSKFFGMFTLFMTFMGAPMLVPETLSSIQLGAFYIFGHIFLGGALAYLSLVPLNIWKPEWKEYIFYLILAVWGLKTFLNFIYWTEPEIVGNIVLWNVGAPIGPFVGIVNGLIMLGLAGGFFAKMAWERSGNDRYKFGLLALGMLVITLGGPLHDNATGLNMYLIADILTVSGFIFVMSGLYIDWVVEKF